MKLSKKIGLTCALALGGIAIAIPVATTLTSCSVKANEKPGTDEETKPEGPNNPGTGLTEEEKTAQDALEGITVLIEDGKQNISTDDFNAINKDNISNYVKFSAAIDDYIISVHKESPNVTITLTHNRLSKVKKVLDPLKFSIQAASNPEGQ